MNLRKPRFQLGQVFKYQKSRWQVRFVYNVVGEKGIWYYMLEEIKPADIISQMTQGMGGREKVEWIPFKDHVEANKIITNIYANGDRIIKSTQDLLDLELIAA